MSQQLIGRWEGKPDTAAARQQREARAKQSADNVAPAAVEVDPGEPTDLEAFDFRITLEFAPRGQLTMQLGDEPPRDGSWRVEPQAAGLALLELTDMTQPPAAQSPAAAPTTPAPPGGKPTAPRGEQRRFELQMEPQGKGFTLREEGADPQFGWLYFQRQQE